MQDSHALMVRITDNRVAEYKTIANPLLTHRSCNSLAIRHRYAVVKLSPHRVINDIELLVIFLMMC